MSRRSLGASALALGLALLLAQSLIGPLRVPRPSAPAAAANSLAQRAAVASSYGQLPLAFEVNEGQAGGAVRFLAHGSGYTLALTPSAALLVLSRPAAPVSPRDHFTLPGHPAAMPQPAALSTLVGMQWLGANPHPLMTGEQPLPGTVNYFIGNVPSQWHTNIPTYEQVRYHDVYPGVDLVYYGNAGQLEYDFVVAPGADPTHIALNFTGAARLGVDLLGNLSLALPGGTIAQEKPLIYQQVNGARQAVAGGYTLTASQRVGFALGAYNPHLPLVIDPAYRFSTYLGGSGQDQGNSIAVDAGGNVYLTGVTNSTNFPTANALQASNGGFTDAFVSKLNAAGSALVYSTYLGGSADETGYGIAVDASGNAYVTGTTDSLNFPTHNPLQASYGGGGNDTFVSKLNASGSALIYSTFLGGLHTEYVHGIALDASGNAYVTGQTNSPNFPTHNPLQASLDGYSDAFVSELNAAGSALVYSTYLGGSADDTSQGIAVDSGGNAYITGHTLSTDFPTTAGAFQMTYGGGFADVFVSKLNAAGSALVYSTYLGGTGDDEGNGIAVDASGNAYVTGYTQSANFPTANPLQGSSGGGGFNDAFLSKFNAAGSALVYSTYLGGNGGDIAYGIAVDAGGNAYITGQTVSPNFPTHNPLQASKDGYADAFVSKVNAAGNALAYSSFLGGSGSSGDLGNGIAVGVGGNAYVTGWTYSTDFPTANALQSTYAGSQDAFVTKMNTLPSAATTTGVFRPTNGNLYLKNSNSTGFADITLDYGLPGDQPITGDWTGKGYNSIGIYRGGTFYLRNSNTTGFADITVAFGAAGDIPVAGDWTGKGYDSVGVYRPSNSTFYLRDTNTSGPPDHTVTLGISGDVPIVGDWTAKGWDSVGVFRPSNGIVYLRNSNTTGFADINFVYGIASDKPVVGDWDANGTDTIGVDRAGNFLLRNSNSTGPANLSFYLGVSGDDPIAGPWLAPASAPPPVHRGPSAPSGKSGAAILPRWPAVR